LPGCDTRRDNARALVFTTDLGGPVDSRNLLCLLEVAA
jgi:hypothetical protein